jgi:hypothetical protein
MVGKVAFVNVGLEGPRLTTNRVRGDYDEVMAGVRAFLDHGLPLSLSAVVYRSTLHALPFTVQPGEREVGGLVLDDEHGSGVDQQHGQILAAQCQLRGTTAGQVAGGGQQADSAGSSQPDVGRVLHQPVAGGELAAWLVTVCPFGGKLAVEQLAEDSAALFDERGVDAGNVDLPQVGSRIRVGLDPLDDTDQARPCGLVGKHAHRVRGHPFGHGWALCPGGREKLAEARDLAFDSEHLPQRFVAVDPDHVRNPVRPTRRPPTVVYSRRSGPLAARSHSRAQ